LGFLLLLLLMPMRLLVLLFLIPEYLILVLHGRDSLCKGIYSTRYMVGCKHGSMSSFIHVRDLTPADWPRDGFRALLLGPDSGGI
jgi:hypothetical protein